MGIVAYKIKLPGTFTDAESLAVRRDDPILPASGALMLVDMSTLPSSGVPATYTNIAAKQAATLLGEPVEDMHMAGSYQGTPNPSIFAMERSGKGGLHGIASAIMTPFTTTLGFAVDLPAAMLAYLFANIGDTIYTSLWSTTTRAGSNAASQFEIGHNSTNYLAYYNRSGVSPVSSDRSGVPGQAIATVNTPYVRTMGVSVAQGTPVEATSVARLNFGSTGKVEVDPWNPGCWVFYRLYMENLTESGRSVAAVRAIDFRLFSEAFATGGRFHGDTWTNPTTIP